MSYTIRSSSELTADDVRGVVELQNRIFDRPYTEARVLERIDDRPHLLAIHAYHESRLVGFKIGYGLDAETFYSWIGGIDPAHRRRGLAKRLMDEQHRIVAELGFTRVRTKTRNEFKDMLIANLRAGFEITATFTEPDKGFQIVLEKDL